MECLKLNKVGPHCIEEDNRTYMSSLSRVPLVVGIGVDTRDVIIPQRRVQHASAQKDSVTAYGETIVG